MSVFQRLTDWHDRQVAREDTFFDDVAAAWREASLRQKIIYPISAVAIFGAAVAAYETFVVGNIDVSSSVEPSEQAASHVVVSSSWDGLTP